MGLISNISLIIHYNNQLRQDYIILVLKFLFLKILQPKLFSPVLICFILLEIHFGNLINSLVLVNYRAILFDNIYELLNKI